MCFQSEPWRRDHLRECVDKLQRIQVRLGSRSWDRLGAYLLVDGAQAFLIDRVSIGAGPGLRPRPLVGPRAVVSERLMTEFTTGHKNYDDTR